LKIQLIRGSGLPAKDINGLSDPYVIFTCGNQTVKSRTKLKTLTPEWNETLMLYIEHIADPLILDCYDFDKFTVDDYIGKNSLDLRTIIKSLGPGVESDQKLRLEGKKCENAVIEVILEFTSD